MRLNICWLGFAAVTLFACSKTETEATSVEITFPEDGAIIRTAEVRVEGTAEGTDTVVVNGEVTDVVGGTWQILIPFQQGEVEVTANTDDSTDTHTFTVDSLPPSLVVTSPDRGHYFTEGTDPEIVRVTGTVEDNGAGLELLKIGETVVIPAVSGAWQHDVVLKPGLNRIAVVARDLAGNESSDVRAVMYGTYEDPTTDIVPGMNVFVRPSGIKAIEETIEQVATPEFVANTIREGFMNESFELQRVAFDPLEVESQLKSGAIGASLVATNIEIGASFTIGGNEIPGTISVARVAAELDVILGIDDGQITIDFENDSVTILEEDITFNIAGTTEEDADFIRGIIVQVVEYGFGQALSLDIVNNLYDPDILIRKLELLGRELVFELKFDEIRTFTDGLLIKTVFVMPSEKAFEVRDVPGALSIKPGPGDSNEPEGDLFFTTARHSIDRLMHGIWRSGVLHPTLHGSNFAGFELPFELTAAGLAGVLDARIATIAGPDAVARIRVEPYLPLVTQLLPEEGKIRLQAGELRVIFQIVADDEPKTVAVLSSFVSLDVEVSIDGVLVGFEFGTDLATDLIEEPLFDLDDERAEKLFRDVILLIPTLFAQELTLAGEADILWISLSDPHIIVHGPEQDYVSFGLSVSPNPDGIESP